MNIHIFCQSQWIHEQNMPANNLLMSIPTLSSSGLCRSLDGHNKVKTRRYFEDEQDTVTCLKFIIR